MIQVSDTLGVFMQKLRLARYLLALLDEVENHDGRSIAFEKVVKMSRCRGIEWIHDADWDMVSDLDPDLRIAGLTFDGWSW